MVDETQQSVWNFDGAEYNLLFEIKTQFVRCMIAWNLEQAYWAVRTLRMELDAMFKRAGQKALEDLREQTEEPTQKLKKSKDKKKTEKEEADEDMNAISKEREKYLKSSNPSDAEKGEFYQALESFYMRLCYAMKRHKMYFREGDDSQMAVLRR
jgi:ElaB/YqjD/DUF883 family membrane-anchored ribosome-binding protein